MLKSSLGLWVSCSEVMLQYFAVTMRPLLGAVESKISNDAHSLSLSDMIQSLLLFL